MTLSYGKDFIAPSVLIPDELFKLNDFEIFNESINIDAFEPVTELNLLDDTDDNINTNELVENQSSNFYKLNNLTNLRFNSKKYNNDMYEYERNERHKYIISMPTKPQLKNLESFHILLKLTKTNKTFSDNIMAKILSDNFVFNKSFFRISEEETEIKVTKKDKECNSYFIRIKIYYDNIVVEDEIIDLYARAKKCTNTKLY